MLRLVNKEDKVLHVPASPIVDITPSIRSLAKNMVKTCNHRRGLALAAPQVGRSVRMFVTAQGEVWLNPVVQPFYSEETTFSEGCLSLPGQGYRLQRCLKANVRATSLDGKEYIDTVEGLMAQVWQHECDHLNGILICDIGELL